MFDPSRSSKSINSIQQSQLPKNCQQTFNRTPISIQDDSRPNKSSQAVPIPPQGTPSYLLYNASLIIPKANPVPIPIHDTSPISFPPYHNPSSSVSEDMHFIVQNSLVDSSAHPAFPSHHRQGSHWVYSFHSVTSLLFPGEPGK